MMRCMQLALVAVLLPSFSLRAQASMKPEGTIHSQNHRTTPSRVPVTVALVDELPGDGDRALVLRRHDQTPHDVIVLKRSVADGALLSSAVLTLLVAREIAGNAPRESSMLRVNQTAAPVAWRASEQRRADRVVSRARGAPPREVAGLGLVSAVDIYLREDALRGRLKAKHRP